MSGSVPTRHRPGPSLRSARAVPAQNWHARHQSDMAVGDRAADVLRNGMGSWRFVFGFLAAMALWALVNSVTRGWDPYPFILLNLFLSMLAGLQGAILLIAAKRQDAVAAALAQHDYETNIAAKEDVENLLALAAHQATELESLRSEMLRRLDTLGASGRPPAEG
jgi:uncharacterized membrane protein